MKKHVQLVVIGCVVVGLVGACQTDSGFHDDDISQTARPLLTSGTYEIWRGGPDLADGTNPPVTPEVIDGHSAPYWGTGTDSRLYVGATSPTSSEFRAVIRWDLGFVPPNATVTSAVARVAFNRSNQQQTVTFHQVTSPWTETSSAPEWETYDPAVIGSFETDTWTGTRDVDITALAQAWVNGAPNHGVLLEQTPGGGTTQVYSSERATESQRPRLLITFDVPPPTPPAAPDAVAADPGDELVGLQWAAASTASSYSVKRSTTSGGPYTTVATGIASLNYLDTGLTNDTTYYYVVTASNAAGESPNSPEAEATPVEPPPPPTPSWIAVTGDDTFVQLTWTSSAGATSYELSRSTTPGGPYTSIATTSITEHTDGGLTNNVTYYYVVAAVSASGSSDPSEEASATPTPPPPPPAPISLVADPGDEEVALDWATSAGATSYIVKRSDSTGGPYTSIANTTVPTYVDSGLTNGTTYYYVVSAENTGGESADSSEVSGTPEEPPPADDPIRIAYVGDYGTWGGGSNPDTNAQAVADMIAEWNPDYVITGGDNVYDNDSDAYPRIVGHYYGDFIADQRFFPIMGNHDWDYGHATEYYDYFDYLPGNRRYYEQPLGANDAIRMFAVNSDWREPDGNSVSSVQATWLAGRLATSSACFDVVVMHNPAVSSSVSGSGPAWGMDWPFASWGAEAVFQSHVHAYERLLVDGIPYFLNGLGGGYVALQWNDWSPVPQSQFRFESQSSPELHYGAQLITVVKSADGFPSTMTSDFYALIDGEPVLIDSTTVSKVCD